MFGILNLFKPAGPTSRDCVNHIQRLIRPTKVGHAGTLDPIAEGVLLIAVGSAVRLVDWIHQLPKSYRGTFELGKTSPSVDTESEVTSLAGARIPTIHDIQMILPEFRGLISQVPPIYSAVRIDGKRAYQSARAGKSIEMPARQVTIHQLSVAEFSYPRLVLEIECSTGTYIRSLGRDLARRLGTDAIMTTLLRQSIGDLLIDQAVRLEELDSKSAIEAHLCNPVRCLARFPQVRLDQSDIQRLHQGKILELPAFGLADASKDSEYILALDDAGTLRSILSRYDALHWRPHRNFLDDQ